MNNTAKRFYEIEQSKLLLDFEKISLFTKHPTSLGAFRESRLRQYLRDFTPKQLSMGTGFVSAFDVQSESGELIQSRQIDCLVFDETQRHPELWTSDYVVIRPEALYAAIEIKSELTLYKQIAKSGDKADQFPLSRNGERFRWAGTLIDALQNIKSIRDATSAAKCAPFLAIFGYNSSFDIRRFFNALDNGDIQQQLGISHIDDFPPAICVPGKFLIHLSPYDFTETAPHHDSFTAFMNVIEPLEVSAAYPLQFFTNFYLNQIGGTLTGSPPSGGGLNSGSSAKIKIWVEHFDLNTEGYEDQ
ncbi:DUF6602 domain-containing protein [Burkholderia sp. Bmkn7]|uniref:DUF6602 domain-containing protein n=1 Tax=Burkholderia sp. Bmkn7 TaxID=3236841 RepID=UPI0034E55976